MFESPFVGYKLLNFNILNKKGNSLKYKIHLY